MMVNDAFGIDIVVLLHDALRRLNNGLVYLFKICLRRVNMLHRCMVVFSELCTLLNL